MFNLFLILLLCFVSLFGCSKNQFSNERRTHFEIAEFQDGFDLFEKEASARGKTINFHELQIVFVEEGIPGICHLNIQKESLDGIFEYQKRIMLIRINRIFWRDAHDFKRERLLFHELGHCIFDKDHNDESASEPGLTGYPKSIMHHDANSIPEVLYYQYRSYYMDELLTL
jgi:hypothetical protein